MKRVDYIDGVEDFALFQPGTQHVPVECSQKEGPTALPPPPPGRPPEGCPTSSPPFCPAPAPPLQDVLTDGSAIVEVVEADGDAVPENEGALVLLFVGAEGLLEVFVGLEAAAQLHGRLLSPHQGLAPRSTTGVRGHTMRGLQAGADPRCFQGRP